MWDDFFKQFLPSLIPLLGGGSVFAFLMHHQRRREAADRAREHRARMYELAYRYSDAYARNMAQLAGPAAQAAMEGNTEMALTYCRLLFNHMSVDDPAAGRRLIKHPDHLQLAKRELDLLHLDEPKEEA